MSAVIVAARDEADRIAATIDALEEAFPGARVIVADDASSDGTSDLALARGARSSAAAARTARAAA